MAKNLAYTLIISVFTFTGVSVIVNMTVYPIVGNVTVYLVNFARAE